MMDGSVLEECIISLFPNLIYQPTLIIINTLKIYQKVVQTIKINTFIDRFYSRDIWMCLHDSTTF